MNPNACRFPVVTQRHLSERGVFVSLRDLENLPNVQAVAAERWAIGVDQQTGSQAASRHLEAAPEFVRKWLADGRAMPIKGVCLPCGCTHERACVDPLTKRPCSWANPEQTLCTMCAPWPRGKSGGPRRG